jgi:hypothetical protein
MGQYYLAIILADKKTKEGNEVIRTWCDPRMYGNGLKLTEHAYINNNFMKMIEYLLSPEGMFYMSRIVWGGDYADEEKDQVMTLYGVAQAKESLMWKWNVETATNYRYIVNHTKRVYIDKEVPSTILNDNDDNDSDDDELVFKYHPLALLVSEGNGRGGGDYSGKNEEWCGTWARDVISMELVAPIEYMEVNYEFEFE